MGGLVGASCNVVLGITISRIGLLMHFTAMVFGQVVASVVVDQIGLPGDVWYFCCVMGDRTLMGHRDHDKRLPLTRARSSALAIVLSGVVLVLLGSSNSSNDSPGSFNSSSP